MKLLPWALLVFVLVGLVWLADDASEARAELRAVRDSVALVVAQERRIRAVLETDIGRHAQAAAVAREAQRESERRVRASTTALREHLADDTAGTRQLDELEAEHLRERTAWERTLAARDSQMAALGALVGSYKRELGAVRTENEALAKRVSELERERGPALACTVGAGATLGGNGVGAVCGVELVRVPLRKVWSVITPW